ncbi:MAG: DUF3352 domain-containing protein, partial [Planctomycetota bacterium]
DFTSLPQGEFTFAIIAPRRQKPEFFLLMELDQESESLDKVLNRGRDLINDESEIESEQTDDGLEFESFMADGKRITFFNKDGLVVGCSSREILDAFIDRWADREVEKIRPLAKNRKFVTIMNRCRGGDDVVPEARFFIDPIGLAKSSFQGNFSASASLQFLPVFGLDGLAAIGGSTIFSNEDFESIVHGHVLLANPRNGLFKMIAMKPTIYEPEQWIPQKCSTYMTTSWDVDQFLDELTKIIENFYEEGTVERWMEEDINQEVGFDFKEDFLNHLSGRITFAQWIEEPIRFNSQITAISVGLSDVEAFENSLDKIYERIQEDVDEDDEDRLIEIDYKGVRVWTADEDRMNQRRERWIERRRERAIERGRPTPVDPPINSQQPSFAIIGSNLVFSMSPDAIKSAIDVEQGDAEALVLDESYNEVSQTIEKFLKRDMPVSIGYTNPGESLKFVYELIRSSETNDFIDGQLENNDNRYLRGFKNRFDDNPLPEFEAVEKYFKPNGWLMTDDDTGFHFLAFQVRSDPDDVDE